MRKRHILHSALGLGLGIILCVILAGHADIAREDAAALLENINPWAVAAAFILSILMIESGARKWAYLDRRLDGRPKQPHRYYLRHFIWQNWLAQLLPATVALIAGRAVVTHATEGRDWKRGLRSGLVDQLSELFIILAFIPATLWQLHANGGWQNWLLIGVSTALVGGALACKLFPRYCLPVVLLWSFIRVALITLRLICGALAFGLPIAAAAIAWATPLATLTVLVPLTPGNLGLSEWGWTYALTLWQVNPATAALYAISFRLLVLVLQTLLLLALPKLRAR